MADRSMNMSNGLQNFPDHALLIANIIARWNATEHAATKLLSLLSGAGIEQSTVMLHALHNSRARLDVIKAAGKHALEKHSMLAEFVKLVQFLADRISKRNVYAHGLYATDEQGRLCILNPAFDWIADPRGGRPLPMEDLRQEVQLANDAFNRTIRFYEALWKSMPQEHAQALHQVWLWRLVGDQAPRASNEGQDPTAD